MKKLVLSLLVFASGYAVSANDVVSYELDSHTTFACCNSYLTDAETGESFVAVTYCSGDNSVESYIVACVAADGIRDKILAFAK